MSTGFYDLSNEDLAYAAGIVDGEGCISIARHKRPANPTFDLSIQVAMKSSVVPTWLHNCFGGSLFSYRQSSAAFNQKPYFKWAVQALNAKTVITEIEPYLKEKKAQALLALQFPIGRGHREVREALYLAYKELRIVQGAA